MDKWSISWCRWCKIYYRNNKNGNSVYKYNVEHISNIEIIDNGTIKLTLDANIPFFEYYLIFPILSSTQYNGEDFYASQQVPIGTGRYQISNVSTNSITLTYNQNWKNPKMKISK